MSANGEGQRNKDKAAPEPASSNGRRRKAVATLRSAFSVTDSGAVLEAAGALPSARTPASRAVYGASTAQEDALTRRMRQDQAVGPRAAGLLQTAQHAIRLWLCKDEDVLEMPGPVRAFLQDAAGNATLWAHNLETIDRLQGDNADAEARQHNIYRAAQSLQQQPFSDAVRAACSVLPTQSTPTTEKIFGRTIQDWFRIQLVLSPNSDSVFRSAVSRMGRGASLQDLLEDVGWGSPECKLDTDGKWFVDNVCFDEPEGSEGLSRARRQAVKRLHAAAQEYQKLGGPGTTVLVHVVPAGGGPLQTLDAGGTLRKLYQSGLSPVSPLCARPRLACPRTPPQQSMTSNIDVLW